MLEEGTFANNFHIILLPMKKNRVLSETVFILFWRLLFLQWGKTPAEIGRYACSQVSMTQSLNPVTYYLSILLPHFILKMGTTLMLVTQCIQLQM